MSTTVNNEDLELEEGEIAEDSNDEPDLAPDLDCTDKGDAVLPGIAGVGGGISCEAGPQKKRKKVVRKVRRKIKVKKKVVRKKGGSGNNESGGGGGGANAIGGSNANVDNNMSSSMSNTHSSNLNNHNQSMLPSNAPLLPHISQQSIGSNLMLNNQQQQQHHHIQQQHHNPYQHHNIQNNNQHHHNLLPQTQQQHHHQQQHLQQTQTNSTQLDSLWEQQILVLQELQRQQQVDQQLTQILRAAATDEDFRIFPSPLTMLANSNQQTMATQLMKPNTTIASAAASNTNTNMNNTITHSPSKPMILHSQTPSSPDDENGKSSYEAISKMLTLLRNSANVSDSSENLEIDNNNDFNSLHHNAEDTLLNSKQEITGTIEYSLIPILIEGIDYTKYKLLSQYEPKFKLDPRLNQQT